MKETEKENIKHNTSGQLLLSIIVPVYNAERYLEECLRSLFVQNIPAESYEVIAVDNGSRDGSAAMIKRLQNEYTNLQVVTLVENQLPSGGRNAGMDAAVGKYLMFVDSDDYLYPNVLRSLIDVMEKENLDFVHFDADILLNGELTEDVHAESTPLLSGVELYHLNLKYREVSWSKIYRRAFIELHHLRCAKGLLYEDDEFSYRLYSLASRVRHYDFAPYVYRENQNSATKNRRNLLNIESDLVDINMLHEDICGKNKIINDSKMIEDIKQFIYNLIQKVYLTYRFLPESDKKIAKQKMRKYITWRMLPYMSKKRFILLHLGVVM